VLSVPGHKSQLIERGDEPLSRGKRHARRAASSAFGAGVRR
jgi:hypothetical protein